MLHPNSLDSKKVTQQKKLGITATRPPRLSESDGGQVAGGYPQARSSCSWNVERYTLPISGLTIFR